MTSAGRPPIAVAPTITIPGRGTGVAEISPPDENAGAEGLGAIDLLLPQALAVDEVQSFGAMAFGAMVTVTRTQRHHLTVLRNPRSTIGAGPVHIPLREMFSIKASSLQQRLFGWAVNLDLRLMPFAPQFTDFPAIAPTLWSQFLFASGILMAGQVNMKDDPLAELRAAYSKQLSEKILGLRLTKLVRTNAVLYLDRASESNLQLTGALLTVASTLAYNIAYNLTGETKAAALTDAGWLALLVLSVLSTVNLPAEDQILKKDTDYNALLLQQTQDFFAEAIKILDGLSACRIQLSLMAHIGLAVTQVHRGQTVDASRTMAQFAERFGIQHPDFFDYLLPLPIPQPLIAHLFFQSGSALITARQHQSDTDAVASLTGEEPIDGYRVIEQSESLVKALYSAAEQIYDRYPEQATARRLSLRIKQELKAIADGQRILDGSHSAPGARAAALVRREKQLQLEMVAIARVFKFAFAAEDPSLFKRELDEIDYNHIHQFEVQLLGHIREFQDIAVAEDRLGLQTYAIESRFNIAQAKYFLALCKLWQNQDPEAAHELFQEIIISSGEMTMPDNQLDAKLLLNICFLRALACMLGHASQEDTTVAVSEAVVYSHKIGGQKDIFETDAIGNYLVRISRSPFALTKPDLALIRAAFPNPVKPVARN